MINQATLKSETRGRGEIALEPWDLWDRPFVYTTEDLDTFLLFLEDEESKEYEISRLAAYSLTLRLTGPDNSSVLYTSNSMKLPRDGRYRLYGTLKYSPVAMPRFSREKLAAHVGRFFSLKNA